MESLRGQELVNRYHAGQLTATEQRELENLIEKGEVELEQLTSLSQLHLKIDAIQFPQPSEDLDDRFYQMLALTKREERQSFSWSNFFSWPDLAPKLALASVTLIIGLVAGYLVRPAAPAQNDQISALVNQVSSLQEVMMLNMLEKESAAERLKAVSLTSEMKGASKQVTSALIKTLNNDENVNVRMAALEALIPYVGESEVREAIIRSIAVQDSPLVQVALAELMAKIQEKSSVEELQKIIQSDKTPTEVKNKIKESIKILS
jgi:hypothetical protein